jgi:hypothetical protein
MFLQYFRLHRVLIMPLGRGAVLTDRDLGDDRT